MPWGGEIDDFIIALPGKQAAKIDDHIEEHLNGKPPSDPPPEFPVSSRATGELRELRVRFADRRYRILSQRSGNLLVLLHAFEKDRGSIAEADIELAKKRMSDFNRRMDAKPRRRPRAAGQDAPLEEPMRDLDRLIKIDKLTTNGKNDDEQPQQASSREELDRCPHPRAAL